MVSTYLFLRGVVNYSIPVDDLTHAVGQLRYYRPLVSVKASPEG